METNQPIGSEWESTFEEKFYLVGTDERDFDGQKTRDEVKDFIRALLAKERSVLVEAVLSLKKESDWRNLKRSYDAAEKVREADRNILYNRGISDVLALISK